MNTKYSRCIIFVLFLLLFTFSLSLAQPIYLPAVIDYYYEAGSQNNDYIIPPGCTVTGPNGFLFVDEGVTILASTMFDPPGSITVTNGGKLFIDGESDNRVTITSDNGTSTWGGIHFTSTASPTTSAIQFCDISHAEIGIHMETYIYTPGYAAFLADSINYCETGILVENGDGMDIQGCTITNCTYGVKAEDVPLPSGCVSVYQCDLLNNTYPVRFEDCGYVGFRGKIIGGTTGVYARYCERLEIDYDYELPSVIKSKIEDVTSYGVYCSHVQDIDINMLEVDGGDITNWGIYVNNYGMDDDTTSITSSQTYDMDYSGVRLYSCDKVYIDYLDSYYNHRYGVQLTNIDNFYGIYSSNLHRNDYGGLYMYNVHSPEVYWGPYLWDSYLGNNNDHGLVIEESYLIISESTISDNGDYGIYVYDGVELEIEDSQISDNGDEGIRVNTSAYTNEIVDIEIDGSDIINNDDTATNDQIYTWLRGFNIMGGGNYIFSSTTTWEISGPAPSALFSYNCTNNYWGEWPNAASDVVNPACAGSITFMPALNNDPGNGPFPEDPWADGSSGLLDHEFDQSGRAQEDIDFTSLRNSVLNSLNSLTDRIAALNTFRHQNGNAISDLQEIKNQLETGDALFIDVNSQIASCYKLQGDFSNALNLYVENNDVNHHIANDGNILETYYMWAESIVLNSDSECEDFEKAMNSALAELPLIPGTENFKPSNLEEYQLLLEVLENGTDSELGVGNEESSRIESYELNAPYPNPFNPNVTIPFSLPESSDIKVEVYNLLGEKVVSLVNGTMEAGRHQVVWNGIDNSGQQVASGIYYVKMQAQDFNQTSRIVFMK